MHLQRICVFCGSRTGQSPTHQNAARALGHLLAERGITLVYGGGRIGLMGVIADSVLSRRGKVIGVIPDFLSGPEVVHTGLSELHVVTSMHERKALMAELSDGFVALPGGYGTLEEFFEAVTWAQLGLHQKPCALLNVSGYFNALLQVRDHAISEGFVRTTHRELILSAETPEELISLMVDYHPSGTEMLLHKEQI